MHGLITDVIDSYGGTDTLIRTLNRLGICSSMDTLSRIIQYRVRERQKVGPEHELSDKALIIILADNIDFLHSFSRVYCGEKKKSFHGATIQAVQPIPSLKSLNVTQIAGQKRPKLPPYPSPNKSFNCPVSKVTRRA